MLTVEAKWRNLTPFTVEVDTEATRIDIFIINEAHQIGFLDPRQTLGQPLIRATPLQEMKQCIFEPKTETLLQHHFILELGHVYLIRWKLYRLQSQLKPFAYTKEIIFDGRQPTT